MYKQVGGNGTYVLDKSDDSTVVLYHQLKTEHGTTNIVPVFIGKSDDVYNITINGEKYTDVSINIRHSRPEYLAIYDSLSLVSEHNPDIIKIINIRSFVVNSYDEDGPTMKRRRV